MGTYVDTRIISLNSQSATQYNNGTYLSSMNFNITSLLKNDPDIIHRQITLQSAQLPVSFYIINSTNNVLILRLSSQDWTVTIPVGNYNATTLITALIAGIFGATGYTFTITISKINGKLTFQNVTAYSFRTSLATFTIGTILGLISKTDIASSTFINTVTPLYPLNLLGQKSLQVSSSRISTTNFSTVGGGQTTLLGTIPVTAGAFGLILYTDTGASQVSFNNHELSGIDINITDAETNEFINFNNCHWTMTILLHTTRKYLDIPISLAKDKQEVSIENKLKPTTMDEQQLQFLQQSQFKTIE